MHAKDNGDIFVPFFFSFCRMLNDHNMEFIKHPNLQMIRNKSYTY